METAPKEATPVLTAWETEKYYQALRELIKHEDSLLNERVKILVSLQTLLFGVVAVFWGTQGLEVLLLIAVGMLTTISYSADIGNSASALGRLTRLWPRHFGVENNDQLPSGVPPCVGMDVRSRGTWYLPGSLLPRAFLVLWVFVFLIKMIYTLRH